LVTLPNMACLPKVENAIAIPPYALNKRNRYSMALSMLFTRLGVMIMHTEKFISSRN